MKDNTNDLIQILEDKFQDKVEEIKSKYTIERFNNTNYYKINVSAKKIPNFPSETIDLYFFTLEKENKTLSNQDYFFFTDNAKKYVINMFSNIDQNVFELTKKYLTRCFIGDQQIGLDVEKEDKNTNFFYLLDEIKDAIEDIFFIEGFSQILKKKKI